MLNPKPKSFARKLYEEFVYLGWLLSWWARIPIEFFPGWFHLMRHGYKVTPLSSAAIVLKQLVHTAKWQWNFSRPFEYWRYKISKCWHSKPQ